MIGSGLGLFLSERHGATLWPQDYLPYKIDNTSKDRSDTIRDGNAADRFLVSSSSRIFIYNIGSHHQQIDGCVHWSMLRAASQ